MLRKLFIYSVFLSTSALVAQHKVSFAIENQESQSIKGAVLYFNQVAYTADVAGRVDLEVKEEQRGYVVVYAEGYLPLQEEVQLSNGSSRILRLTKEGTVLADIQIAKRAEQGEVNRGIIRALEVDTKSQVVRPVSLEDVMNRTTGVRVRASGGLGGETHVNINGFQGHAIRYFKDGIPINYLGNSYTLSTIPLDVLNKVEVYKGVIPVYLASDVLGGAVNFVSNTNQANSLRISGEYGSFNTWRTAVRGHYNLNEHFYIGGEFFSNYADNDYKINTPDPELAQEVGKVRLFHNRFKQYTTSVYVGAKHLKIADLLQLELNYYTLDKQIQHSPTTMLTPFGGIEDRQHSWIPSLRYKKKFAQDKLSIDQFFAYNVVKSKTIDTLQGRYSWLGEFSPRGFRGEGDHPTQAAIDMTFFTSRTLVGFQWDKNQQFWLNNTYTYNKRVGTDSYGKRIEDTQQPLIEVPSYYKKNVVALGLTSQWLSTRLETILVLKHYQYSSEGLNTAYQVDWRSKELHTTANTDWGWAMAAKYRLNNSVNLRFSVEHARRLPGYSELFGDNLFIASNFDLKPEQSLNFNLGIDKQGGRWEASLNGFYRQTKDIIVLTAGSPPLSLFVNKERAQGYGFEGDVSFKLTPTTKLFSNFTWQSIRYGRFENIADQWLKGNRVPNIPYFFANIGAEHKFNALFTTQDVFTLYAHLNFVREFYIQPIDKSMEPSGFLGLFGSSKGDVKNVVPDQTSLAAGLVYEWPSSGWSVGVEGRNLLNQDLYDYYKIQKAGRSFYLKFNYKLN
ncbi:TonB-dependent receptor [Myroides sp. 1354]|uniref:TonB-dependent receptor n=1 Tax=unclassified Myroides TaxID=2642485 RepID=UPI002575E294|nr:MULTISPECIES: TonB-dependent receptor [unclassified Myroides]MDM1044487.1 TonB-dependent receptor [Myroides sp. R163-1]MDM1056812.1 TonB-dependent receptor [Myroides sp. 1354]MDM1069917.1 TonB-dependent receptor [Myroides sp. 1372]